MFKISPIQSEKDAEKFAIACSSFIRSGCFIYAMTDCDSGEIMGFSQFEILDGYGYIYDIKEAVGKNDFEAMFILGRQTMNFIDQCGLTNCRADLFSAEESLLKAIGFKKTENFFECSTIGMFDGSHCAGH